MNNYVPSGLPSKLFFEQYNIASLLKCFVFGRCRVRILAGTPTVVTCAVCDFPQCSNVNSIIVPEIRHDVFHGLSNMLSVNHSVIPCHIVPTIESVVE
jgi:hypothetical protein